MVNVKKLMSSILVGATVVTMAMPSVFAQTENVNDQVTDNSEQSFDTRYQVAEYLAPVEYYDIDLTWNDLSWVFVYEGSVTNPDRYKWVSTSQYNAALDQVSQGSENELYDAILDDSNGVWDQIEIGITATNNSNFQVNIVSEIIAVNNNDNYTNSAGLQIAKFEQGDTLSEIVWGTTAIKTGLAKNAETEFLVKPTADRFVNDDGATVNVTGEVKLTFTKTN